NHDSIAGAHALLMRDTGRGIVGERRATASACTPLVVHRPTATAVVPASAAGRARVAGRAAVDSTRSPVAVAAGRAAHAKVAGVSGVHAATAGAARELGAALPAVASANRAARAAGQASSRTSVSTRGAMTSAAPAS